MVNNEQYTREFKYPNKLGKQRPLTKTVTVDI
jgi:hypothetical protein